MDKNISAEKSSYLHRYSQGEWRAPIFRDLILDDVQKFGRPISLLDIGCGGGFDSDRSIQSSLAKVASEYLGVEPDLDIELGSIFSAVYRCRFEEAQIPPDSIDIAFAVMVMEHLADPKLFWNKVHNVLRPGGIFWGFTIDARHLFATASMLTKRLRIKDWYLKLLHGKCGKGRYENYDVYYRSNTPDQINSLTDSFSNRDILSFNREGQLDYYLPDNLRWLGRSFDRLAIRRGWPGTILAVRVEK